MEYDLKRLLEPDEVSQIYRRVAPDSPDLTKYDTHSGVGQGYLDVIIQMIRPRRENKTPKSIEDLAAEYYLALSGSINENSNRAAFLTMRYFLMKNGKDINGEDVGSLMESLRGAASGPNPYEATCRAIQKRIVPSGIAHPTLRDYERLVLQSISVAKELGKR